MGLGLLKTDYDKRKKDFLWRVYRVRSNRNVFADRSVSVKSESRFVGKR